MSRQLLVVGLMVACVNTTSLAVNPVLGQLEIVPASSVEGDAGVWVDGQYVGYVRTLRGTDRLVLLPGEHDIRFQLIGYQDLDGTIVIESGMTKSYRLEMLEVPDLSYPEKDETARVRLLITPEEAAVFVDEVFVGHVDRFNGFRGMRLAGGTYKFTIALPGHEAFETEMTVRAGQSYEIKTYLQKGTVDTQADLLSIGSAPGNASQ